MTSYKIKINSPEESRQVQEHAFTLGYGWTALHNTKILYTDKECLFFDARDKVITYSDLDFFDECDSRFEEISVEDFLKLPTGSCHCKVYCGKCKYFYKEYVYPTSIIYCLHPSNKIIESTWLREQEQLKNPPSELNKNNDCKNYEIGVKYENNK